MRRDKRELRYREDSSESSDDLDARVKGDIAAGWSQKDRLILQVHLVIGSVRVYNSINASYNLESQCGRVLFNSLHCHHSQQRR